MPEGPEVKSLVDWLNTKLKNKKINKLIIHNGRYKKQTIKNLSKIIFPLDIESVNCKGKFLYILFKNSDYVMYNTLGMTGWWFDSKYDKHDNIEIKVGNKSLYFNDFRNFGTIMFDTKENLKKKLKTLGADIIDPKNINIFKERLERKRNDAMISTALLDQKVASGCGNYLRAECLYIAKISPYRKIKQLSNNDIEMIWDILVQLFWTYYNMNKGIKMKIINKKYTLYRKFVKSGPSKYKPSEDTFLVYRQQKDPYGNNVTSEDMNGRTIHYVEKIQK